MRWSSRQLWLIMDVQAFFSHHDRIYELLLRFTGFPVRTEYTADRGLVLSFASQVLSFVPDFIFDMGNSRPVFGVQ